MVTTFDFGRKKVQDLVRGTEISPDGESAVWCGCAYDAGTRTLVCADFRLHEGRFYQDVWTYELNAKRITWIGRRRWGMVSGFALSSDGRRVAFLGSNEQIGSGLPHTYRGSVYVYEIDTGALTELAPDAMVAYRSQISSPVWSPDQARLYYESSDRRVCSVDLATGRKDLLPVRAYAVLTVYAGQLVYLADHIPSWGTACGAQIIGRPIESLESDTDARVYYAAGDVWEKLTSPSGRFVLITDRRGYCYGRTVLIDAGERAAHDVSMQVPVGIGLEGPVARRSRITLSTTQVAREGADSRAGTGR